MKSGFTLLELLVALAVLGLVVMILVGSTQYGVAALKQTDVLTQNAVELALARSILSHDLSHAFPEWQVEPDGTAKVTFDGERGRLDFLSEAPDSMGRAGLVRYTLSADEATHRLELAAVRELGTTEPAPASVLVDRLADAEFAYWGPDASGGAPAWQPTWHARTSLPRLIRVRLHLAPDDERQWPEIVVRPEITVDGTCVYDPLTFRCRGR